ncbi:hypothetical protein TNIN_72421 [Trichonephila inaurata madagascariensis]|uniref:Uncharacterized protein n=1 Tax=Trichonephila inaurata madagascariensis TaxID=2747483 RepID=A0A8X6XS59_9ARAC|nr:hypothetical protein TNIN_72421 [Trichonephila inaurata madagascariensis]
MLRCCRWYLVSRHQLDTEMKFAVTRDLVQNCLRFMEFRLLLGQSLSFPTKLCWRMLFSIPPADQLHVTRLLC